jgi:hypothetical protein
MTAFWERDEEVVLFVSRDGGETLQGPRPIIRPEPKPFEDNGLGAAHAFPRSFGWPVLAVDPRTAGRLFVVWGDYRHGDRDVFCVASGDQGTTWSAPVRVNDDPVGNGRDQLTQFVAVDPTDGAVYVLFYDRRDDPDNVAPTVTLARSTDGGRTFTNYGWGTTPLRPTKACFGDYIGLAARSGRVYAAWVEDVPTEHQRAEPAGLVQSGRMTLKPGDWPSGPAAIRVGVADFGDDHSR